MKDASKQKVTGSPHTQQMTLHVIANPTKLCTPGSIISEMLLFNASTVWKKIHSMWMKDEYITPNMGKNIKRNNISLQIYTIVRKDKVVAPKLRNSELKNTRC